MKQLYLLLLFMLTGNSFAQDARLFENYWYLTDLIDNGVSHLPPGNNMGVSFGEPDGMMAHACLWLMAAPAFENNTTDFSLTNFNYCLCWCTDPEADAYEPQYFSFFNHTGVPDIAEHFTYTITESGTVRTLTIASDHNKQAVYSNVQLANVGFEAVELSLFPNPATDNLVLQLNAIQTADASIEIYDQMGKVCKREALKTVRQTLDLHELAAGVYFLSIRDGAATAIKKFVKL